MQPIGSESNFHILRIRGMSMKIVLQFNVWCFKFHSQSCGQVENVEKAQLPRFSISSVSFHIIHKLIYPELKMLVLSGLKGTILKQDNALYEIYFYENNKQYSVAFLQTLAHNFIFSNDYKVSQHTEWNPHVVPTIVIHSR